MRSIIILAFMAIYSFSFAQNNLLDSSTWTVGNGSVTGFDKNGTDAENVRELSTDPFGNQSILWKAVPDAGNDRDGGWITPYLAADNTKTYRYGIWIKKTNSNDGKTYFGLYSQNAAGTYKTFRLDGTLNNNPYFYGGYDLPELDKWYLLIGFLHNSAYTGTSNVGGIYDPVTGNKIQSLIDYKMGSDAVEIRQRAYLYYDTNTADRQYFYDPTIYEVNGQEPTITELLNPGGNNGGGNSGSTVWNTSGSNINYTAGKVSVGTATVPNDYLFAVNGKIISEELKVQLNSQWPDYVFTEDYSLPTLKAVEKHIQEKGHLINMPSASEVEANGIEVGEMNKLLLEKIEELTLYILEQEKEIKTLKKMEERINHLETIQQTDQKNRDEE